MDAAALLSSETENPPASSFTRFCETAVAILLGLGMLYGVANDRQFDGTVVPIERPDAVVVATFAGRDFRADTHAALQTPDDDGAASTDHVTTPAGETANVPRIKRSESWSELPRLSKIKRLFASGAMLATVVGIASTYNPFQSAKAAGIAPTASGEPYLASDWTAAIQIDLRAQFGGVRYGRFYRPTFALVESGDKRVIVRINDVGPLRPGRVIDLNERSMRYFDPSLHTGLLHDAKITLLPGDDWTPGPVGDEQASSLASAD
jgi:rare lipoprotein A